MLARLPPVCAFPIEKAEMHLNVKKNLADACFELTESHLHCVSFEGRGESLYNFIRSPREVPIASISKEKPPKAEAKNHLMSPFQL